MKKRVTHLITGLGKGGAETMLYQILKYNTDLEIQHKVVTFGASHFYEPLIKELGIKVVEVQIKKKPLSSFLRLIREIKGSDTLCCWMYYANLVGYYLGRLTKVKQIVWCIRHSNLDPDKNSKLTLIINRHCAKLSKNVSAITYNGVEARRVHEEIGYCSSNGMVLGNGVDCEVFRPDALAKASVCQEIGITTERRIILSIARDHPIKDIPTFIEAFSILKNNFSDVVAVMCGYGLSTENKNLCQLCEDRYLKIGQDIFLLGMRNDIPRIMAGCDLYVLHSAGEAFPNTLIQAMSCGCLCVATDVGDVKRIMCENDLLVPPHNSELLAQKISSILDEKKERKTILSNNNRLRVQKEYSIRNVVSQYEKLFV